MLCFLCKSDNFNCKSLVVHLKIFHSLRFNSTYECNEGNCNQAFGNLDSFRKHLKNICFFQTLYFLKEIGKAPKGRIYSKYFNQLRSLKNCGLLGKRTYTDTKEETFDRFLHPDSNLPGNWMQVFYKICHLNFVFYQKKITQKNTWTQ